MGIYGEEGGIPSRKGKGNGDSPGSGRSRGAQGSTGERSRQDAAGKRFCRRGKRCYGRLLPSHKNGQCYGTIWREKAAEGRQLAGGKKGTKECLSAQSSGEVDVAHPAQRARTPAQRHID